MSGKTSVWETEPSATDLLYQPQRAIPSPLIPQEMPKGLTNSSCNIYWMQNYRALVNQQGNELKWENRYEEHPPCSTLPTEPKGWEGLHFWRDAGTEHCFSSTLCAASENLSVIHYWATAAVHNEMLLFLFTCRNVLVHKFYSHSYLFKALPKQKKTFVTHTPVAPLQNSYFQHVCLYYAQKIIIAHTYIS